METLYARTGRKRLSDMITDLHDLTDYEAYGPILAEPADSVRLTHPRTTCGPSTPVGGPLRVYRQRRREGAVQMSDTPPEYGGEGWWLATDGKWYPPHRHPEYTAPPQDTPPAPPTSEPQDAPPAAPTAEPTGPSTPTSERAPGESLATEFNSSKRRRFGLPAVSTTVRALGFVALAVAALIVMANSPESDAADVAVARLRGATNAENTESAPQQQVANGWETNDLLEVVADRSVDDRPTQLLLILVLAVCWYGFTSTPAVRRE